MIIIARGAGRGQQGRGQQERESERGGERERRRAREREREREGSEQEESEREGEQEKESERQGRRVKSSEGGGSSERDKGSKVSVTYWLFELHVCINSPSANNPGQFVNLATSTIFTANDCLVVR